MGVVKDFPWRWQGGRKGGKGERDYGRERDGERERELYFQCVVKIMKKTHCSLQST